MPSYRNISEALPGELTALLREGERQESRVGATWELLGRTVTLTHPCERIQVLPHRCASPAAQIAETLWMLSGRADISWLGKYLPRASQFSDDGKTWRGAYGPRLRAWAVHNSPTTIDQLSVLVDLLKRERGTRRAVLTLWDPLLDLGTDSLDVPCNNWIQFIERDGWLHMHVAVRSNDVWWGWSGIDSFSWSVLLEAMSCWTGLRPGSLTTFIGSFHLYERHAEKAQLLINSSMRQSPYKDLLAKQEWVPPHAEWQTPYASLDMALQRCFDLERLMSREDHQTQKAQWLLADHIYMEIPDPFLQASLFSLMVYNRRRNGANWNDCAELIGRIRAADFREAMLEWLSRQNQPQRAAEELTVEHSN